VKFQTKFGFEGDIAVGGHNGTDTSQFAMSQVERFKRYAYSILTRRAQANASCCVVEHRDFYISSILFPFTECRCAVHQLCPGRHGIEDLTLATQARYAFFGWIGQLQALCLSRPSCKWSNRLLVEDP